MLSPSKTCPPWITAVVRASFEQVFLIPLPIQRPHPQPAHVLLFWFPTIGLIATRASDTTSVSYCAPLGPSLTPSNFLPFTSYLTYQNEVRNDRLWLALCLSAPVIHGNGKGANGSCGRTWVPAILCRGCLLPKIINY